MFWKVVMLVNVLTELKVCPPLDELESVHVKSRSNQAQSSAQRAKQETVNLHKWNERLHFVQTMKNRTCHRRTKSNRCKAMLVLPMNADLKTSCLPDKASSTLQ
jgi:hypothetical protein